MSQISEPTLKCGRHAQIPATQYCAQCAMPLCDTCARPQQNGTYKCPVCSVSARAPGTSPVPEALRPRIPGSSPLIPMACAEHPEMKTTVRCDGCGSYVCETCDFKLQGNLHACPTCAMNSPTGLTSSRKKLVIAAFLLALWSTVATVLVFIGFFANTDERTVDAVFAYLMLYPTIIGTGISLCAMERRLHNPTSVWVAFVWNAVMLTAFTGLIVLARLRDI